jgi:hypothetical protein
LPRAFGELKLQGLETTPFLQQSRDNALFCYYLNPCLVNPLQRIPSRKARSPSDSLAVSLSIERQLIHEHQLNQSSSCLHSILHHGEPTNRTSSLQEAAKMRRETQLFKQRKSETPFLNCTLINRVLLRMGRKTKSILPQRIQCFVVGNYIFH